MISDEDDIPEVWGIEDLDAAESRRSIHIAFLERTDWSEGLPLCLSTLYASKADLKSDKKTGVNSTMRGRVKEAVDAAAERAGMETAEFVRRGLWLLMRFPSLVTLTDEDEEDYKKTQGGSRWHKATSDPSLD